MIIKMVGSTDIGMKRKNNQDGIYFDMNMGLGIVCDGIGGRSGGEVASSLAVNTIRKYIEKQNIKSTSEIKEALSEAIEKANSTILNTASETPQYSGMGTTLNCLYFSNKKMVIGHVGDSRTYMFYEGNLWQLTMDHSVEEFLKRDLINPDSINKNAKPDALVRALGLKFDIEIDLYEVPLTKDSIILSCSDGLSGMVKDEKIAKIIKENQSNLQDIPELLINEANRMGGQDNITVFLAKVEGEKS